MGRHIAEAIIAAGHTVTFFNRGMTDASLFADQVHLQGDRYADVRVLETVDADILIDTSGYTPDSVRASALAVAGRAAKYIFVSSIDAYDLSASPIDEASATKVLPAGGTTSEPLPELYGAHKVLCEKALVDVLGADHVIAVRAGLMAGPFDNTDRFTYWPVRIARGGDILTAVGRSMPVQLIDVRDVANWIVEAISRDLHGVFNLTGTPESLTFGDVLDACVRVSGSDATFHWASAEFLEQRDVGEWVEMPLWCQATPDLRGLRSVKNDQALANGLHLRSIATTVADCLAEYALRPSGRQLRAGLSPEREATLLKQLIEED